MDCRAPGFPVLHCLPELTQTHVHWVNDAIQPSHPLSSPSPPALSLTQHQGLFQWVRSLHQVAKLLKLQLQHQSFQWISRVDWFPLGLTSLIFLQSKALSRVFSSTTVWKHGFNFHGPKNMLSHWICHDAPEGRDISESLLLFDFSPSRRMVRQWFFSRSLMGNTKQLHRELKFTIF